MPLRTLTVVCLDQWVYVTSVISLHVWCSQLACMPDFLSVCMFDALNIVHAANPYPVCRLGPLITVYALLPYPVDTCIQRILNSHALACFGQSAGLVTLLASITQVACAVSLPHPFPPWLSPRSR